MKPCLIYVAGPFSPTARQRAEGREDPVRENIAAAELRGVELAKAGFVPVIPHANTAHPLFLDAQTPEWWYGATLEIMRRCDGVSLLSTWRESSGAVAECRDAFRVGLPVFVGLPSTETEAVDFADAVARTPVIG